MRERMARRFNTYLMAQIRWKEGASSCRLLDMSATGARVQGDAPAPGTRIIVERNGISVEARIAWRNHVHAGLVFDRQIDPKQFIAARPALAAPPPIYARALLTAGAAANRAQRRRPARQATSVFGRKADRKQNV